MGLISIYNVRIFAVISETIIEPISVKYLADESYIRVMVLNWVISVIGFLFLYKNIITNILIHILLLLIIDLTNYFMKVSQLKYA